MGNSLERISKNVYNNYNWGRSQKRKWEPEEPNDSDNSTVDLQTPKRKHFKSTSKYIYETLYLKGQKSDVTIKALGREWHLHKHYLCQSRYFSSMFSGPWNESSQKTIHIDITDNNIDEKGLNIVFGSLYKDYVIMKPVDVISVLSAACLFLVDPLIPECVSIIKDSLSVKSVCTYYTASQMYVLPEVEKLCMDWLLHNVMYQRDPSLLKEISEDLMERLIQSAEMFVLQVEMDVYSLLKRWVFLRCNLSWDGDRETLNDESDQFFKSFVGDDRCFLQCPEGKPFICTFQALRWQHIVLDMASIKLIENDRIIPKESLKPFYEYQWMNALRLEQGIDDGPKQIDKDVFLSHSMRCGRILQRNSTFCWRWVGYSYGVDLIITFQNRLLSVRRSITCEHFSGSVTKKTTRNVCVRLTAASLSPGGHAQNLTSTDFKFLSLKIDEPVILVTLGFEFRFPLVICMNILFTNPLADVPLPHLAIPQNTRSLSTPTQTEPSDVEDTCVPRTISHGDVTQLCCSSTQE